MLSKSVLGASKGLLIEKALLEKVGELILTSILRETGLRHLLLLRDRRRARLGVLAGQGGPPGVEGKCGLPGPSSLLILVQLQGRL